MVAVPVAPSRLVTVPETLPVDRVKFWSGSTSLSSTLAMRSFTDSSPAAMVTGPLTVVQVAPLSVDICSVAASAVSTPRMAEPLLSTGVKLMSVVAVLSMLTVNSAAAPSTTLGLDTLRVGRSSSSAVLSGVPLVLPAR
ncbi:hypothetical protein D3C85_460940 [compost metagenome]